MVLSSDEKYLIKVHSTLEQKTDSMLYDKKMKLKVEMYHCYEAARVC